MPRARLSPPAGPRRGGTAIVARRGMTAIADSRDHDFVCTSDFCDRTDSKINCLRRTGGLSSARKPLSPSRLPMVRIPPCPPFQNRTANPWRSRLYAGRGGQRLKQMALRADDADLAMRDLDTLGKRAEMVAAIAAAVDLDPLTCRAGKLLDHLRRDRLLA